ncbi:T9SS type A sorting domain-containing protein [bacterium SCSIO 12741]|nr:T9SS type A sorting domain-containing protein [bacterium SCSIO 12741]
MAGYFAKTNNESSIWVSHVSTPADPDDPFLSVQETAKKQTALVFPNPVDHQFKARIELDRPEVLQFSIYDAQGKLVRHLLKQQAKTGVSEFSFFTFDLDPGVYILRIEGDLGTQMSHQVMKR